jgi:putative holliday junction resolvase
LTRLLGLDIGKRKVGIAISDQTNTLARAIKKVQVRELRYEILCLIETNPDIEGFVVGLPLKMNGELGEAAEELMQVGKELAEEFKVKLFFEDERLTSWAARELLQELGYNSRQIAHFEDQTAAQLILQSFLNGRVQAENSS